MQRRVVVLLSRDSVMQGQQRWAQLQSTQQEDSLALMWPRALNSTHQEDTFTLV